MVIFSCKELFEELERVLNHSHLNKFGINIKNTLKIVRNISVIYKIEYPIRRYIPEDQDDDYLIALALQTNSGFISSGDKHILLEKSNLEKKYKNLKILTKGEFEKMFS